MTFMLGARSRANLRGVHPQLIEVTELAITYTVADFGVHEGVRTIERQRAYVAANVSWTMASKHLVQPDGYGHAVDLVPYIDGQLRWEWRPIYHIAAAVRRAAIEVGVSLVWGGVWDRTIAELGDTAERIQRDVEAYCQRHPGPDRIDGPHYQLVFV
jgi:peptidoglycan L-alanyl-D-glutamate endopeptidase CwlK